MLSAFFFSSCNFKPVLEVISRKRLRKNKVKPFASLSLRVSSSAQYPGVERIRVYFSFQLQGLEWEREVWHLAHSSRDQR